MNGNTGCILRCREAVTRNIFRAMQFVFVFFCQLYSLRFTDAFGWEKSFFEIKLFLGTPMKLYEISWKFLQQIMLFDFS